MTLSRTEPGRWSMPPAHETERILAALRKFADLPAWLSQAMDPGCVRASLERHVHEFATGTLRLVACEPSRLRAKGDQWLARYELVVADSDGCERPVVLVGVLEPPNGAPPGSLASAPSDLPFGHADWAGRLSDLRLRLRTTVSDHGLPALPLLTDPTAAQALLQECIGREAYPGIRIAECVPEVVRYKPGSRCTLKYQLRYDTSDHAWPETVVVKTHQGDKGANAFDAMRALWATDLALGDVVTIARPLAYLPESRVLVQAAIPGDASLKDAIRAAVFVDNRPALAGLRAQLHRTAEGLAALHRCGVRYGRIHTWDAELAEVRNVVARLSTTVPALTDAANPLLARLQALADTVSPGHPAPAHHDFRPAQVLLHNDGVGFIDFDGFCMAEPALDIGRFRAKLRDIGVFAKDPAAEALTGATLAERLAVLDELCEVFLDRYQELAPISRPRVLLWETLDLLTSVLHAWTKVRSARVGPRMALLEHQVQAVLCDPTVRA
jgi:aminoglycoside phosphotransferase (APT) family kinase protein